MVVLQAYTAKPSRGQSQLRGSNVPGGAFANILPTVRNRTDIFINHYANLQEGTLQQGRILKTRASAVNISPNQDGPAALSYYPLIISNGLLAIGTSVFPAQALDLLLGAGQYDQHFSLVPLMRLAAAGFLSAALISIALKQALQDKPISQRKFTRLNLGLSAFATLNLLLLVTSLVSPEGVLEWPGRPGFYAAAVCYLATVLASWGHYSKEADIVESVGKTVSSLGTVKEDVKTFVQQRSLDDYFPNSYTAITLSLAAWGFGNFFLPHFLLDHLIQNEGGQQVELLGRLVAVPLITLLPATSYSLKEVAKDIKIKQLPSRFLNASLAFSAVLNIAVLLPYLTHGKGGLFLGPFLLLWAATLTTSLKYGAIAKE